MNISYKLPLHRYTVEQMKRMVKDHVITRNEMNDELDERGVLAADLVQYGRRWNDVQFPDSNDLETTKEIAAC